MATLQRHHVSSPLHPRSTAPRRQEDSPADDHAHDDQDAVISHHDAVDAHGEQYRPQQHIGELEGEVDLRGQALACVEDDLRDDEGDGHDGEGDDEAVEPRGVVLAGWSGWESSVRVGDWGLR